MTTVLVLKKKVLKVIEKNGSIESLGGETSHIFLMFTPKIGEDESNLTFIFLRWVGSTTNQMTFATTFKFWTSLWRI